MAKGEFIVSYTNKDIMDKLDIIHIETAKTNGTIKLHTKLIFGAYGFTLAVLLGIASCIPTILANIK